MDLCVCIRDASAALSRCFSRWVDIPLYGDVTLFSITLPIGRWQKNLILKMMETLNKKGGPAAQDRLGVFTLWSHDISTIPQRIIRTYTHEKVGIVDDKWKTIGSANLDGVSLHMSQHILPPISKKDRVEERAIEVNAVIFDGVDGLPPSTIPNEFRRSLWAEHLGYNIPNDTDLRIPPSGNPPNGGWIRLWKDRAEAKLADLKSSQPSGHPARILKWSPEEDPVAHLNDIGLPTTGVSSLVVEQ